MKEMLLNRARQVWRKANQPDYSGDTSARMFDGDERLFASLIGQVSVYGEYGVGLSTIYAYGYPELSIIAVDSSNEWILSLERAGMNLDEDRVNVLHVDLGPLGEWGRPISYEKCENFASYTDSIWQHGLMPELILIDGRFRVSCFMRSVLNAKPGSKVIFDDYVERPTYHVVERILPPTFVTERQALFVVPESLDRTLAEEMFNAFLMVMD